MSDGYTDEPESPGASRRHKRADRILDAAAALVLRWGYNKTTIDDISREAGVAKGTIYLHWSTRQDLFESLIQREKLEIVKELKQSVAEDPEVSMLRGIAKFSALALMKRPLFKALFLRDVEILGKLARSAQGSATYSEGLTVLTTYLDFLRDQRLVRSDIGLQSLMYTYSAIITGFFLVAPLVPEEISLSDKDCAELMAETVHRALETDRPVNSKEMETIAREFTQFLDRAISLAEAQYRESLEP